jgi:nicotinate-nucleotide adenylyltransferase
VSTDDRFITTNWQGLGQSIGILGGTFDPIQRAHIEMAQAALAHGFVDSVVLIPAKQNPHKDQLPHASDEARLAMIQRAVGTAPNLYYSDIEITSPDRSYTHTTITKLRHIVPETTKLFFVLGADAAVSLPRWHRINELVSMIDGFLVFPRQESVATVCDELCRQGAQAITSKMTPVPLAQQYQEISSTNIRTALDEGNQSLLLASLDKDVLAYIQEKKLYQ